MLSVQKAESRHLVRVFVLISRYGEVTNHPKDSLELRERIAGEEAGISGGSERRRDLASGLG